MNQGVRKCAITVLLANKSHVFFLIVKWCQKYSNSSSTWCSSSNKRIIVFILKQLVVHVLVPVK